MGSIKIQGFDVNLRIDDYIFNKLIYVSFIFTKSDIYGENDTTLIVYDVDAVLNLQNSMFLF